MTEENIIKLTNALYKVTSLFPKEEPLKFAIRKESLDILFFSTISKGQALSGVVKEKEQFMQRAINKIDLLFTYFDIARNQEWVNERNFSVLEKEYIELKKVFSFEISKTKEAVKPVVTKTAEEPKAIEPEEKKVSRPVVLESKPEKEMPGSTENIPEIRHINYEELSGVQLKVLEVLQSQGQLRGAQISQFFPETNPRTIRREIKGLKELKIIISNGGGKTTSYEINRAY